MRTEQPWNISLPGRVIVSDVVAAIPKADLHLHAEAGPRLQRLLAEGKGEPAYDWHSWAVRLMRDTPPGNARLDKIAQIPVIPEEDNDLANFRARIVDVLEEEASSGAIYAEVRFGRDTILRSDFISLFREAEAEVQQRHTGFLAEPLVCLFLPHGPNRYDEHVKACLREASRGLAGVDLIPIPYDLEADWSTAYRWTEMLSDAGLGITAHAAEFTKANLESALRAPGINRIGHAVYAATDQRLIDLIVESGVAIEVSLTSNLILGAVEALEHHPISRFIEAGIPISINTDDPVHFQTSIGREYEIAHRLGLNEDVLRGVTQTAILHSFTTPSRREQLLNSIRNA